EQIDQETLRIFKKNSNLYGILLLVCLVSFIPLYKWLGLWGLAIWIPFFALAIFFCIRLEKMKKEQDVHSYKEIVAFMNGEKLDDIGKAREEGKRNYQKVIAFLAAALFTALVLWIISLIV
ncbi:MAG: transcriptional regulator, partial [Clostridia bacterium]|nr:transcriptional regulator [Clostridia bacterium]